MFAARMADLAPPRRTALGDIPRVDGYRIIHRERTGDITGSYRARVPRFTFDRLWSGTLPLGAAAGYVGIGDALAAARRFSSRVGGAIAILSTGTGSRFELRDVFMSEHPQGEVRFMLTSGYWNMRDIKGAHPSLAAILDATSGADLVKWRDGDAEEVETDA